MKHIYLLFFGIVFSLAGEAQVAAADPEMKLSSPSHDFGSIAQGKPVYHSFTVTNTSNTPLIINNVQTSCGCTTPEWSRDAIAPGATTTIKVGYNAASIGPFEKYITVLYNDNKTANIKISGNVWKMPEGAAPPNASIQLLKNIN